MKILGTFEERRLRIILLKEKFNVYILKWDPKAKRNENGKRENKRKYEIKIVTYVNMVENDQEH